MATGDSITDSELAARFHSRWVRHQLRSWGATAEEPAGPYPGAGLVPEGKRSPTMAVTIDAPPGKVWPWLIQMGWDRGGWYSWDLLDNAGRRSATAVHPEWQDLARGDQLTFRALGRVMDAYRVAVIEPNRFLGLYGHADLRGHWLDSKEPRPPSYMEAIWGFLLSELPDGRTRLVIGGYQTFPPAVGGTVRSVAPPRDLLAHAGSDDGGTQTEHRASGQQVTGGDHRPSRGYEVGCLRIRGAEAQLE